MRPRMRLLAAMLVLLAGGLWCSPVFADSSVEIVDTVCRYCHGEAGNSLGPDFPKLAGQQAKYIEKQLADFVGGYRPNELMASFLPFLKREDIPRLASYYASQKPTPWPANNRALMDVGKKIYEGGNPETGLPACVGCHHAGATGCDDFPRLASQSQAYILRQLTLFKNGLRTNDKKNLMRAVAAKLREDEMQAVAEYLSGLQ